MSYEIIVYPPLSSLHFPKSFALSLPYLELRDRFARSILLLPRCLQETLRYFGKIICVINEDGIHHKDGLIKWDDIVKIEYEIELPGGVVKKENLFCHAVIYTRKEKINLIHAPMFLISKVKKYQPSLEAKVSKNSKWMIGFMMVLLAVAVPVIPLFA